MLSGSSYILKILFFLNFISFSVDCDVQYDFLGWEPLVYM
jgi:hypothetical protein